MHIGLNVSIVNYSAHAKADVQICACTFMHMHWLGWKSKPAWLVRLCANTLVLKSLHTCIVRSLARSADLTLLITAIPTPFGGICN